MRLQPYMHKCMRNALPIQYLHACMPGNYLLNVRGLVENCHTAQCDSNANQFVYVQCQKDLRKISENGSLSIDKSITYDYQQLNLLGWGLFSKLQTFDNSIPWLHSSVNSAVTTM